MKLYVAMCSLSLITGAGLGYVNGKVATVASFVDDCAMGSIVELDDVAVEKMRRFHCFEIDIEAARPTPASSRPEITTFI